MRDVGMPESLVTQDDCMSVSCNFTTNFWYMLAAIILLSLGITNYRPEKYVKFWEYGLVIILIS